MDIAVTNPFVVGRYISDKYFCDREQETDFLIKQIENGRNVALISPRRLGKTGLIITVSVRNKSRKVIILFLLISIQRPHWLNLSIYWGNLFMTN